MQIFARLTKVDEASRTVSGVIASEAVDRSGEVFDYETSKPLFEKWSTDIAKATDGKSVGNVRAMHGNVAAGKLSALHLDDAEKAITVNAKIVDDNEWNKVKEGVYTGFSIGGKYVGAKWPDPVNKNAMRYTARPHEVSLVDLPCNPDAMFSVVKADGSQEMRKFAVSIGDAEALAKWVDGLSGENRVALSKSLGMSLGVYTQLSAEQMDAVVKAEQAKIAERKDVNPKEGADKYGDVKFADEANKKYPIDTPAHIRAAWNYINKPKNAAKYDAKDLKTIKSKIVSAWKDKIDANGPPSAEAKKCDALADSRAAGLLAKIDRAEPLLRTVRSAYGAEPLAKDLWNVGQLADLVSNLNCITLCAENEANWEGDNSAVPGELRGVVRELAGILLDMADEEVEELVSAYEKADADGDLRKVAELEEESMNAELQKAHDEAKAELAKVAGELAAANEALAKVNSERDDLAKSLETITAERDELNKGMEEIKAELEKIAKQPAPAKGAARVVEKTLPGQEPTEVDDKPVLKGDGSVDHVATAQKLAKLAYRTPVSR